MEGPDGDIRIFDARTDKAEALATVKVHRAPVTNMRLHPQLHAVQKPPRAPMTDVCLATYVDTLKQELRCLIAGPRSKMIELHSKHERASTF